MFEQGHLRGNLWGQVQFFIAKRQAHRLQVAQAADEHRAFDQACRCIHQQLADQVGPRRMPGDVDALRVAAMGSNMGLQPHQRPQHLRAHGRQRGVRHQGEVEHDKHRTLGDKGGRCKAAVFFGQGAPVAAVQVNHDRRVGLGGGVNVEQLIRPIAVALVFKAAQLRLGLAGTGGVVGQVHRHIGHGAAAVVLNV